MTAAAADSIGMRGAMAVAHADAMCHLDGPETPVGPMATIAAIGIVHPIEIRAAELLVTCGARPLITRASVVGADRSRDLFEDAYREHARRIARVIAGTGDGHGHHTQEV